MATLTQLEYLVAVDRHRHFGKAAKACQVSQPTLSMQLQKMEEEYKVSFFDRSKQPILPNPEAVPLIDQAKQVLREFEKFKHQIAQPNKDPAGEFKLGIIPTVAPYLLPHFIGKFAEAFPKVNMSVRELTTEQILEGLERDEIDAAILATPLDNASLDERPLYYENFFVYASEGHALLKNKTVDPSDLTLQGIWLLSEGHCLRSQVIELCNTRKSSGVFKNLQFESGSLEGIIELVDQGYGYTLIPAMMTKKVTHPDRLRAFKSHVPTREISLVFQRAQYKQSTLKAVMDTVKKNIPETVFAKRNTQMDILQVRS